MPVRVLVVDDSEVIRRSVCLLLRRQRDLEVICEASNGIEAVERAQELKPDVVLLDISMPKLNGIQAAQRIRVVAPESGILFLSQHDSNEMKRAALESGGHGYVVKSEAGRELAAAVRSVAQRNRSSTGEFS